MPVIDLSSAATVREMHPRFGSYARTDLGDGAGLSQFGVAIEVLEPGALSSERHWHEEEDEFLMVLEGAPTLVENRGECLLAPGDCLAWPKGVANAHHLVNRSDAPLRYLVAGWRAPRDVVHYPDIGRHAVEGVAGREMQDGAEAGADDLPTARIDLAAAPVRTGSIYPEPYAAMMAGRSSLRLGQMGGLTQFGANLVTLQPGALASLRHWHEAEDEFLIVTEGSLVLVDDHGNHPMGPGDVAAFPAGAANGHHMTNRSAAPASFLVIGTRAPREVAHYSDHDFRIEIDGGNARFTYRDGTPWEGPRQGGQT